MKKLRMTILLVILLFAGIAAAGSVPKVDGSSDASAQRSYKAMFNSLDEQGQQKLATAMLLLNMEGVTSMQQVVDDPALQSLGIGRIRSRVDGMTADEIIKLAATASANSGLRVLDPDALPGVPRALLEPLPAGLSTRDLAGTAWKLTSNTNGYLDTDMVRLEADGTLRYLDGTQPSGSCTWEQSGDTLRIHLNDGFAVLRGTLHNGALDGRGGNRNGSEWTWIAEEITDEATARQHAAAGRD